jgi:hypothetical protein
MVIQQDYSRQDLNPIQAGSNLRTASGAAGQGAALPPRTGAATSLEFIGNTAYL